MATGYVELGIENLDIDLVITLGITDKGYIHPVFHDVKVDLGGTYFYFENGWLEFLAWQIIEFTFIMIENSIYFVGPFLLTDMASQNIDRMLDGYQIPMWVRSPIDMDHDVESMMLWDLRQTSTPVINNGFVDFSMVGELRNIDS